MSGAELAPFVAAVLGDRAVLDLRDKNEKLQRNLDWLVALRDDQRILVTGRSSFPIVQEAYNFTSIEGPIAPSSSLMDDLYLGPVHEKKLIVRFTTKDKLPTNWDDFGSQQLWVHGRLVDFLRNLRSPTTLERWAEDTAEDDPNQGSVGLAAMGRCDSTGDLRAKTSDLNYIKASWVYPVGRATNDQVPLILNVVTITELNWDACPTLTGEECDMLCLKKLLCPWRDHVSIGVNAALLRPYTHKDTWKRLNEHLVLNRGESDTD